MPSRVVRGEILSSESLSRVSVTAELVFTKLIVYVDDYGRGDARLPALRAALFPMRKALTEAKLEEALQELESGEDPPVQRYRVDGREYLYLTGWETHRGKSRRAKSSKYPEPHPRRSEDCTENPSNPPVGKESGVRSRESRVESREPPIPPSRRGAKTSFPVGDRLALEARLVEWGAGKGFTPQQIAFALDAIETKSDARGYTNIDWYRACQGYIREGWPLRGHDQGVGGTTLQTVASAIEESRRRDAQRSGPGSGAAGDRQPVLDLHGDEAGGGGAGDLPAGARRLPGRRDS